MKIYYALAAFAATSVSAFESTRKHGPIDTNRAPRIFHAPKGVKPGFTYAQEIEIAITAEMDTMGMDLEGTFDAIGDMEIKATEQSGGSTKIDMVIQNVAAELASPILSFQCDSNDQAHSDENCAELFGVVGATETLLVDKDGNLLEMTTPDGQTYNVAAMEQQTLQSKFQANQLAASQHFDKGQQFLELIPNHAVRPGDSWIDDITFDDYGNFKGTSRLVGYTDYKGADCALFRFDGSVHANLTIIADAVGFDLDQLPSNLQDTIVTNDIIYDVNDDIIRWVEVNLTTAFDIANPLDPNAEKNSAHIPVALRFSLATDILERPDPAELENAGASESNFRASSSSSSYAKAPQSKTSSGGGGGGAFKGIFFALLVGVAAAGGFMFYKKRQEGWEFVRPSYEFSRVSADPIYNSPPLV